MKFIHRARGIEGKDFSFSIEINPEPNNQLKQPLKLKIIKQNFLLPAELEWYENYFSFFAHPLTNSFHYKSSRNSIYNFHSHLLSILFPSINDAHMSHFNHARDFIREEKRLRLFLKKVQSHFLSCLDQEFIKKVRSFTHERWMVYCFLKKNNHPYTLQMLDSAPAIISMLSIATIWPYVNSPFLHCEEVELLVKSINSGAKPKIVLAQMFDKFYLNPQDDLWSEFRANCENRVERARTDWIWLALHAPACCSGLTLLSPPPFYLCKSDIPKNKLARANWIKRIKMFKALLIPEQFLNQVNLNQLRGLELVLSKSAPYSYQYIHRKGAATIDYLADTKRVPGTKTHFEKFFSEVKKYHSAAHSATKVKKRLIEQKIKDHIMKKQGIIQNGELHIIEDHFELHALTTMDELECESLQMNNCVANQFQKAFFKAMIHFHVKIESEDFTLALVPETSAILDFKGARNRHPKACELNVMKEKLQCYKDKVQAFLDLNLRANVEFTTADS